MSVCEGSAGSAQPWGVGAPGGGEQGSGVRRAGLPLHSPRGRAARSSPGPALGRRSPLSPSARCLVLAAAGLKATPGRGNVKLRACGWEARSPGFLAPSTCSPCCLPVVLPVLGVGRLAPFGCLYPGQRAELVQAVQVVLVLAPGQ